MEMCDIIYGDVWYYIWRCVILYMEMCDIIYGDVWYVRKGQLNVTLF